MGNGHVFVVSGKIGDLVADAAIIPTDGPFTVEPHWHRVIAGRMDRPASASQAFRFSAADHKPTDWSETGWGRSRQNGAIWFLDVYDPGISTARFDRLRSVLRDISRSAIERVVRGRPYPLVVVPMIGTEGGGRDDQRGDVLRNLLRACDDFDDTLGDARKPIDIAIVVTNAATYGALQYERRRMSGESLFAPLDEEHLKEANRLGNRARNDTLGLFIGAGASMPAGAPSWTELLQQLAAETHLGTAVIEKFSQLGPLDQAQLLSDTLGESELTAKIKSAIADRAPTIGHALVAGLDSREAITTNYDDLYEKAVQARGGSSVVVLPGKRPRGDHQWLLKLHGDLNRPASIVLTRHRFVTFPAVSAPSGAILQTIMLTKHLLIVGASMNDDNVLRLIHEVVEYRHLNEDESDGVRDRDQDGLGTILDVSGDEARAALHGRYFTWLEMPGNDVPARARNLEVFLDAVGMYASDNQSWLLDHRFANPAAEAEQRLAINARQLFEDIETAGLASDPSWGALHRYLRSMGAGQQRG